MVLESSATAAKMWLRIEIEGKLRWGKELGWILGHCSRYRSSVSERWYQSNVLVIKGIVRIPYQHGNEWTTTSGSRCCFRRISDCWNMLGIKTCSVCTRSAPTGTKCFRDPRSGNRLAKVVEIKLWFTSRTTSGPQCIFNTRVWEFRSFAYAAVDLA